MKASIVTLASRLAERQFGKSGFKGSVSHHEWMTGRSAAWQPGPFSTDTSPLGCPVESAITGAPESLDGPPVQHPTSCGSLPTFGS